MDYFKLIDAYVDGELTGSELNAFAKELERNPELASEVKLYKDVSKFLYKKAEELKKREDLNCLHEEFMKSRSEKENRSPEPFQKPSHRNKRKIFYYAAIAASIVIIFGIYFLWRNSFCTNQELFAAYYKPYEISTTTRSVNTDTVESRTLLNKAMTEYEASHFFAAAPFFEQFVQSDTTNFEAYFLLGISYIETDNIEGAIQSFLKIINEGTSLYGDNARWYLALCYLKTDEKQKAIEQFRYMENNDTFCSKQSADILDKIE